MGMTLLVACVQCNALFGIEEAELDDADAGNASGGVAGNGGQGGGAGQDGSAASGGGAGAGAQGGSGASGGGGGLAGGAATGGAGGVAGSGGAAGNAGVGASGGAGGAATGGSAGGCSADLQTDPNNCGSCGRSCLGAVCVAGECQPELVAAAVHGSTDLALTGPAIYWGNTVSGRLYRYDRTTKATSSHQFPGTSAQTVRALGSFVYVLAWQTKEIHRVADSGVTPQSVLTAGALTNVYNLDASGIYWLLCPTSSSGELHRANTDGSAPSKLVDVPLCADSLELDGTHVYMNATNSGAVYRAAKASPHTVSPIGSASPGSLALALSSSDVFFGDWDSGNWGPGSLRRVAKGGGSPLTIATGQQLISATLNASGYVYWLSRGNWPSFNDGSAQKVSVQGTSVGTPVSLGTGLGGASSLAADATHVYWLLAGASLPISQGALWRVAR